MHIYMYVYQRFPWRFVFKSPWDFYGLFGGPTDRVGDSLNFFVRPLSKLCISDTHLCVREKHNVSTPANYNYTICKVIFK